MFDWYVSLLTTLTVINIKGIDSTLSIMWLLVTVGCATYRSLLYYTQCCNSRASITAELPSLRAVRRSFTENEVKCYEYQVGLYDVDIQELEWSVKYWLCFPMSSEEISEKTSKMYEYANMVRSGRV